MVPKTINIVGRIFLFIWIQATDAMATSIPKMDVSN